MRSLSITDSNFTNQREVVKEERRMRVDNQPYMRQVTQRGSMQGQELKTDLAYAGGRVKGSAMTPSQQGIKTIAIERLSRRAPWTTMQSRRSYPRSDGRPTRNSS